MTFVALVTKLLLAYFLRKNKKTNNKKPKKCNNQHMVRFFFSGVLKTIESIIIILWKYKTWSKWLNIFVESLKSTNVFVTTNTVQSLFDKMASCSIFVTKNNKNNEKLDRMGFANWKKINYFQNLMTRMNEWMQSKKQQKQISKKCVQMYVVWNKRTKV